MSIFIPDKSCSHVKFKSFLAMIDLLVIEEALTINSQICVKIRKNT